MKTKQEYQDALNKIGNIDIEIGISHGHELYEDIKTIYGSTFDILQELIDNLPTKNVFETFKDVPKIVEDEDRTKVNEILKRLSKEKNEN